MVQHPRRVKAQMEDILHNIVVFKGITIKDEGRKNLDGKGDQEWMGGSFCSAQFLLPIPSPG